MDIYAIDAATALASGVSSLFGSGKMKSLERKNEDLRDEIAIRDETIEQLQTNIKQMEVEHSRAMMNKDNEHRKALEAKEAEHKEETNTLNSIINPTAYSAKEKQRNETVTIGDRIKWSPLLLILFS